jgi:lipopolysaccharide transport system ATP-binding protein
MSVAVSVDRLSKQYRLGRRQAETMLRDRLVHLLTRPFGRDPAAETIWALKDVSFEVPEGQVVGIIGRNGAGKSTLLKILSRITYATSGDISVRGRIAALLEVGTGFHEELTGRENIFLNGSILGMKKAEVAEKFDDIVSFSGVERFIDTPIKRYSSGMRLRLGFAVAAHLNPDVLIIDEILAVGDMGFQKKCLDAMQDLRNGGRTVLFVSHNMAAVENLCSRCLWIDEGRIRMDGEVKPVIEAYMGTFSGKAASIHDLRSTQGRHGTGEIRYTGFEFLDLDGRPKSVIRSGDGVRLRFHYAASEPASLPSFGFRLYTELGTLVTETGTWHHAIDIPVAPTGDGYLDLIIPEINLQPGRYYFSLWITGPAPKVYDGVEQCAVLVVEVADIYHSGRGVESKFGIVCFPQQWVLGDLQTN